MRDQVLLYLFWAVNLLPLVVAIVLAIVLLELSPARWRTFGRMASTFLVVELVLLALGSYRGALIVSVFIADFEGWIHVRRRNPQMR
jgi:hypothetical protein